MPQRPGALSAKVMRTDDTCVVDLDGEIDLATGEDFSAQLREALENASRSLVVDMTNVYFLGSAGLSALMGINQDAAGRGVELRLVCGPNTRRTMELTGLHTQFALFADRATALTAD